MAERDRRGITARIDRTNHVPVPINVIAPAGHMTAPRPAAETFQKALARGGRPHMTTPGQALPAFSADLMVMPLKIDRSTL